jgi:ferredoxin-NADP reductase/MOSC domain-containing protein YiiM
MQTAGRVLNLFIGERCDVRIGTHAEPTAFPRTPCDGPCHLGTDGLQGNVLATPRRLGRENHALYLFHVAHYRYFEGLLGRAIAPGAFAENITYDGPDETDLRIGDRIRIGGAVVELTLPRVPCYKMAHFLNADSGFPSRFSATGRTGIYARVIEPGPVAPSDSFAVMASDPRNASVIDVNSALTAPRPAPDLLTRVFASPDLGDGLRRQIEERVELMGVDADLRPRAVQITERKEECRDVVSLCFHMDSPPESRPRPGQFVTFGITDDNGTDHFRCYSLIEAPFSDGPNATWRIAVKREAPKGREFSVSSWIHDQVVEGTACTVYPQAGEFILPEDISGTINFIAGGIGITPILAQLRALAAVGFPSPVSLTYVVPTVQDLAFADALTECGNRLKDFRLRLHLSREAQLPPSAPSFWRLGRPDLEAVTSALDDDAHLFVCGPEAMIDTVRSIHAALGRRSDRLHFELFTEGAQSDAPLPSAEAAEISLPAQGYRGTWRQGDGALLKWIETHTDLRPPAACRSGLCRTCRASLLRGNVVYPPSVAAPPATEVLLCCAEPVSDLEIDFPEPAEAAAAE